MSHPDGICPWCDQPMSDHASTCLSQMPRTVPQDPEAVQRERELRKAVDCKTAERDAFNAELRAEGFIPPPD